MVHFISDLRIAYNASIIPIELDLSSLSSTAAAAHNILDTATRLDLLFNNAGIAATAPALTFDGYEAQFGVNYVGHALFTQLLLPLMLKTAADLSPNAVRIINISSMAHRQASGIALAEVKTTMESYHTMTRYGQSKLANILFSQKLAQLYPTITTVALHPGFVNTEINRSKGGGAKYLDFLTRNIVRWFGVSVEDGTKTQLWCGVAKEVKSGEYYEPYGVAKMGSRWTQNRSLRDELWEWTEKELATHSGSWPAAE